MQGRITHLCRVLLPLKHKFLNSLCLFSFSIFVSRYWCRYPCFYAIFNSDFDPKWLWYHEAGLHNATFVSGRRLDETTSRCLAKCPHGWFHYAQLLRDVWPKREEHLVHLWNCFTNLRVGTYSREKTCWKFKKTRTLFLVIPNTKANFVKCKLLAPTKHANDLYLS